jgi:predicted Zn-dependent protease
MQARQQLNAPQTRPEEDLAHALLSARARVLSQNSPEALKAWAIGGQTIRAQASDAERAAALYAATLAHVQLRDMASAQRSLQTLRGWVQDLPPSAPGTVDVSRWVRLLQAEVAFKQGLWLQAVQPLSPIGMDNPALPDWPRPELMALAQALHHLPGHALLTPVTRQLRQTVAKTPHDAQAWDCLAGLLSVQGQALASLRASGEAQAARMDWAGAVDRFRAAQELALKGALQAGENIEASIVDARLGEARARLLESKRPDR